MRVFRRAADPRVAELLGDASGERTLAWGELTDGRVVVCTDRAIHYPGGRVPWDLVVRGAWSEEFLDLVVQAAPGTPSSQVRLRFEAPGRVPEVVRERVNWTVVATQRVTLTVGRTSGGALLTARRSPVDGEVRWSVVFDPGVDSGSPAWRSAADAALADVRNQLGA